MTFPSDSVIINITEQVTSVKIDEKSNGIISWGNILGDIENQTDLISELENPERLAVETPEGKFLRDDGTFQSVSAGNVFWGDIQGDISNQTDLSLELSNKVDVSGDTMSGDLGFDSAGISQSDYVNTKKIILDSVYTPNGESVGTIYFDTEEQSVNFVINNNVTWNGGLELFFNGRNETGSTILNGTPVMFAGTVENSGQVLIQKAIANNSIHPSFIMGITTEDIEDGQTGKVTWFGKVRNILTTGSNYGESWMDNQIIYVSATTSGYLTKTAPQAPNRRIQVATVIHAHTNGSLLVRPTWNPKLTELDDVNGTPLTENGQILVWDNDRGVFDFTENINDYKDASNLTLGTLDGDRLPSISSTKRGGVPPTGTPSGKVLSDGDSWVSLNVDIPIVNRGSGNYDIGLNDRNTFQNITTATVVTIKLDSVVDIPIGTSILFYRNTSEAVSLTKDVGVTLNSEYGLVLNAQYSVAGIIKIAANSWVCFGSLKTS